MVQERVTLRGAVVALMTIGCVLVFAQENAAEAAVSAQPGIEEGVSNDDGTGSQKGLIIMLFALATVSSVAATALAVLTYRMNKLRLGDPNLEKVVFADTAKNWMETLEKKTDKDLARNSKDLQAYAAAFIEMGKSAGALIESGAQKSNLHQTAVEKEMKETRELLGTFRAVAEKQKEEVEAYREGFKASLNKEVIGYLCEARDQILAAKQMAAEKSDADSYAKLLKAVDDLDWYLEAKLESCDVEQLPVSEGDSTRDEAVSGKFKVLGTVPTKESGQHNRIAEIVKPGYEIRVPRDGKEETVLLRHVSVRVYSSPQSDSEKNSTNT